MTKRTLPPRQCSVQGCTGLHAAKGLCQKHYARLWAGKPIEAKVRSGNAPRERNHFVVVDTAFIQLADGSYVLCDRSDFSLVARHNWQNNNRGYACTHFQTNGVRTFFRMHQLLMGISRVLVVDHINRNPSDNRRCNLRWVTRSGNAWNAKRRKDNRSWHKGVTFHNGVWDARIGYLGKQIFLGSFKRPQDAAKAYQEAQAVYHVI